MYSVILAGGSGTRLFLLSRSEYPKQFIPLLGKESLFQKVVRGAGLYSRPDEIYVVTNEAHKFLVRDQLETLDMACHILTEPAGKNTLPAVQYAVSAISVREPEAVVAVFPSDQLIEANEAYMKAIEQASALAKTHMVVFGIVPACPLTGYGYIKPGAPDPADTVLMLLWKSRTGQRLSGTLQRSISGMQGCSVFFGGGESRFFLRSV